MSIIATALKHLIAAGVSGDDLVRAVAEMEAELALVQPIKERSAGAIRTERYRERQRHKASQSVTCDGSDAAPALPLPPNENNSNPPAPTHPEHTPRVREADPFPMPEWCPSRQVWADFKQNRKTKRLPCTATAYAKLIRDVEAMADEDWPPGRLFEAIVARGWAAAHDPRESRKPGHDRSNNRPSTDHDEPQNAYVRSALRRQTERAGAGVG